MKIKRLLTRARLGFVDSILDLAAWINWLQSEERHNPYRCPECGSTDIHMKAWIAPNRGSRFIEDSINNDVDDDWCENCQNYIRARPTDDLLAEANDWWGGTDFREMERVTHYRQLDFNPDEGWQAFVDTCNDWWNGKTTNEKITIYLNNQ